MALTFPYYQQLDSTDCGAACLRMIASHYGQFYAASDLRQRSYADREGVSLKGIAIAAESIGFRSLALKLSLNSTNPEQISLQDVELPCILHWEQAHFVVLYKLTKNKAWIADPAIGKKQIDLNELNDKWKGEAEHGVALILETSPAFFESTQEETNTKKGFSFLSPYFKKHKKLVFQLFLGVLLAAVFQLIFPFLTQAIVDIGIQNSDLNFVYLILIAQLVLFGGQIAVNFIQAWIMLHMGTRINISLVADFLSKLMRLPIQFFDGRNIGDLLQRIEDHERIEYFLTNSSLRVIFSVVTIFVFGIALLIYSPIIFLIFLIGAVLYILWITIFLRKRRVIDQQRFKELSENQNAIIEIIQGIQEIKLQGSEQKRRWKWTEIQSRLFKTSMKSLSINQYQDLGAGFINQLKDILITVVAAKGVIDGSLSLGMMLAIQYIVGYMNTPLVQLIGFIRSAQDARISIDRLNEIHKSPVEKTNDKLFDVPSQGDIVLEKISFKYNELSNEVLKDVNLVFPYGKKTAIVGHSGSGKTTLIKLILGMYKPTIGKVKVNGISLQELNPIGWRALCGAVMQEGYLFSDTIANNIIESDDDINTSKFMKAVKLSRIDEFVENFPLSYNTKIGLEGNGLSQGQKQRVLIARAFYKDPEYLIFDEATNALDASNESMIVKNIETQFENRTLIVIAHRLSTVKNADNIIVLDRGKVVEQGNHQELINNNAHYYQLVRDQLDLNQ